MIQYHSSTKQRRQQRFEALKAHHKSRRHLSLFPNGGDQLGEPLFCLCCNVVAIKELLDVPDFKSPKSASVNESPRREENILVDLFINVWLRFPLHCGVGRL